MATLGLNPSLQVDAPAKVFGYAKTPAFTRHDLMVNVAGSPGYQGSGVRILAEAGILCLEPQPALASLTTAMFTFPSGASSWITQPDDLTKQQFIYMPDGTPDQTFEAQTNALLSANVCFYATINRGTAAPGATLDGAHCFTVLEVGAGAAVPADPANPTAGTPFRLVLEYGRPPVLQQAVASWAGDVGSWNYSSDFGNNSVVAADTTVRSEQIFALNNQRVEIEWFSLPDQNMVMVTIQGQPPLIFRGSQAAQYPLQVASGRLHFYGGNGTAALGYFPMRFTPTGTFVSSDVQLPFVWQGNYTANLSGSSIPTDCAASPSVYQTDDSGTSIAYSIAMTGPTDATGLAYTTPFLREMILNIGPTFAYTTYSGAYADLSSDISEIEENQWFDREKMTIRTQVGINLDNSSGYYADATAGIHLAANYARNLTIDVGGGQMGNYSGPVQWLLGWTGSKTQTWRADPRRRFDIVIDDGLWPMDRKQMGNVGFLDGWCFLAAIRFLANLSGRTDDWIDPYFCTCDFGPNPANCPHFKLPLGVGQNPKMGFSPNQTFLSGIQEICKFVYGVIWADSGNILRIMPYTSVASLPSIGTFTTLGTGDGDPTSSEFLSQMWGSMAMGIDTADRRTGVAFFGIDPSVNEVQGTYLNIDDIPGYSGFTELVHGFSEPLIDVSSLFVDPVFTAAYAASALQRIILPTLTMEHKAAFLPGMSVLNQYNVYESGYVIDGTLALSAEKVVSRWAAIDPGRFGTTVSGRSIYNL